LAASIQDDSLICPQSWLVWSISSHSSHCEWLKESREGE
jgi:hypothetical protein